MYKKVARIGPISFGIFYALFTLLALIIFGLIGAFVLPLIPRGAGAPEMEIFAPLTAMISSGENLSALAISVGMMLLVSFIIGLVFAILYNLVSVITGGIKVKVNDLGYDDI